MVLIYVIVGLMNIQNSYIKHALWKKEKALYYKSKYIKVAKFFSIKLFFYVVFLSATALPFEQTVWAVNQYSQLFHPALPNTEKKVPVTINNANFSYAKIWANIASSNKKYWTYSPFTHLPVLADGQTAMPSNANNFHSSINTSVDPRTGSSSFGFTIASTLYDYGVTKRDLILSYAGGSSLKGPDPLDLGSHWSFNIGTEQPSTSEISGHKTDDISTGDGHSFTMISDHNSQGKIYWHPLRHKIKDVLITGEPGDWTITTARGVREHLQYGYEDWEEGRDGQRIWFYYDRNGPADITRHLLYVCSKPLTENQIYSDTNQCPNNGVRLTYNGNEVDIHGQQNIVLHLTRASGENNIQSISMPSLSSNNMPGSIQPAEIIFSYDENGGRPWLLKTVTEPSGETNTFMYNNESDHNTLQPQGLPTGVNKAYIPVVTEKITTPPPVDQQIIPKRRVWYQYSNGTADKHNFTGYLSGVSNEPGKDNLFDRTDNYTYTVIKDNGLTTTKTIFNKYHLPLTVFKTDDLHHSLVTQQDYTYSPWQGTTFNKLPLTYSFPKQTAQTLYSLTSHGQNPMTVPAKIVQQKRYDDNGQVIWQKDAYGREIYTQYCPFQGDQHCLKMDPSWPQVTLPEKIIEIPAKKSFPESIGSGTFTSANDSPCAVEIEFNYKLIPVAEKYKKRIQKSQNLLQKRWKKTAQMWNGSHAGQKGQLTSLNLFSKSRFMHDVGTISSPYAGDWQVSSKVVGTISTAALSSLQPGNALPELTQSQLSTATKYQYELEQSSPTYGQLKQLTVIKYNPPAPSVKGKLLQTDNIKLNVPSSQSKQLTFNVTHSIDKQNRTRTTDVEIAPKQPFSDIHNANTLLKSSENFNDDGGLSLGKTVYSLVSGVKLSTDDTLKNIHSQWTYDVWQRPIKEVITTSTGGDPQERLWTYISTQKEHSVIKTAANGTQQKIVYTGSGNSQNIVSVWHRTKDKAFAPMEGKSNWIQDSYFTYTQTDKLASKTTYHVADNNGQTIAMTTTYGYDTLNRLTWQKSPNGIFSFSVRNDPEMLLIRYQVATGFERQGEKPEPIISVIQSNILGKPVARYNIAMDPDTMVQGKSLYSYQLKSELINLESKLKPIDSLTTLQSYGLLPLSGKNGLFAFVKDVINSKSWLSAMTTKYDGNGRAIEQIQPNGAKTYWQWHHGNLVATVTPDGSLIHDSYDITGNKVSRCVQPLNQSLCHVLGMRHYNNAGDLAWQSDEYGNKIAYTYDADGRVLSKTTPATKTDKSHVFTYSYNGYAKTSESVDGVLYSVYSYDPKTWKVTDTEDSISHLHYEYDANSGNLIKIIRTSPEKISSPEGIHYPPGVETLTYDRFGQPMSLTDFAGNKFTVKHDKLGRVIQTLVLLSGHKRSIPLISVNYDKYFDRPSSIVNGIGVVREFIYNRWGKLKSTIDKQGNSILQQLSYTYDPQTNNIETFTRIGSKNSATQVYKYDKNTNSLVSMFCSVTGKPDIASSLCPRDTDMSGSQLITPPIITSQKYTFDNWNNIKTVSEKLITSNGAVTNKKTTYFYSNKTGSSEHYDPHRIVALNTIWQDSISNFKTTYGTITYDSSGRVIKDEQGNILHYNLFGQQDGFTNVRTGQHTHYSYDSAGHQVVEISFDAKGKELYNPLYMIYQGNTITEQVQSNIQGKTHVSVELAGVAHAEDGIINCWYLHDYKGDVISTLNGSGQQTSVHVYSPYGMDDNLLNNSINTFVSKLKATSQTPKWQNHKPGFNGQMSDPDTGYQFLGGGYRAYNPVFRRFMSYDSYSPFKKIDDYGFGDNNPVMNTDPTGHMPKWLGYMLGGISAVMAVSSAILLPVAAVSIAGVTSASAIGVASGVASGVSATVGVVSGGLQVAGTALPQNKNLAIANQSFGLINAVSTVIMGSLITGTGVTGIISGMNKFTNIFIISSGISSAFSGVTAIASSDIGISQISNSSLSHKAGLETAITCLGYASMALMAISVLSSLGASVSAMLQLNYRGFKPAEFSSTYNTPFNTGRAFMEESLPPIGARIYTKSVGETTGQFIPYSKAVASKQGDISSDPNLWAVIEADQSTTTSKNNSPISPDKALGGGYKFSFPSSYDSTYLLENSGMINSQHLNLDITPEQSTDSPSPEPVIGKVNRSSLRGGQGARNISPSHRSSLSDITLGSYECI